MKVVTKVFITLLSLAALSIVTLSAQAVLQKAKK